MGKILDRLKAGNVLLSDGAWGTLLQARGLMPGECPESWNIRQREKVLEVARSYVEAGSDMIETNSFGGTLFNLGNYGLQDQVMELNRAAAEISREAIGDEGLVLGSVGPTGKLLITGEFTADEMFEAFREQILALGEGGVDAIIVETMSDLEEASLAIRAARENTSLEVICTMTFEKTANGEYRTMMGVSPTDMVPALKKAGAQVIGSNCGNGTEGMINVLEEIRSADADIPVLIQGNAGMPVITGEKTEFLETPEVTASFIPGLIDLGANIVGGCCGTTPAHIARIRDTLKNL